MADKKDADDSPSEEASSHAESFDTNKSGNSEAYDMKDFCPGIRIEAKDFDGKWYPAKVSDVDWTENEILVHFENWNTKFDEWIPMDSSRLRPLQRPQLQQKEHAKFAKGEEVMAMWSPYQKYPATIQAVLANDRYDVLFYDGFLKRLKSHKISKLEGQTVKTEVRNFTDIGTKEERRERKRKINVAELFHINKRSRKKGLVHSKSQNIKTYPVKKSRNKGSVIKKLVEPEERPAGMSSGEVKSGEKLSTSLPTKALVDTIPAAFEVKYINGQTEMWSKQLYQRSEGRTAGKLDIVILNPQGRKFRSRNEIMKYCEENGILYSHEAFDFSAKGRPKSRSAVQNPPPKVDAPTEDKTLLKKSQRKSQADVTAAAGSSTAAAAATPAQAQPTLTLQPEANPSDMLPTDGANQNKVFIGDFEVVIENGKFICPVKTCGKHFRRENLLHMHMKHYHPEFSKYLDYTPSVTDLAYARTVGGLDAADVSSPAPRKSSDKVDKPSGKVETVRKSSEALAEHSTTKDGRKLKTNEIRPESKGNTVKAPGDLSTSIVHNETVADDNQKAKSNVNSLFPKNNSASNEFAFRNESSERNAGNVVENTLSEQNVPEFEGAASSQTALKSLRHQRLHGRKKPSRFQGSFAEQMRKRRLISQDNSRSQSKLGRQQQSQHQRQQLQEVAPAQTTIPAQSSVDETNSAASGQAQTFARYPKSHSLIPNEISGKNTLLTSSNTLSPVSETLTQTGQDSFESDENGSSETDINYCTVETAEGGKASEVGDSQSRTRKKALSGKQFNRRTFLTGLINARKRREKTTFCLRKKRKKKVKRLLQPQEQLQQQQPQPESLCNERTHEPGLDREPDALVGDGVDVRSVNATTVPDASLDTRASSQSVSVDVDDRPRKGIRLKIKRIDSDRLRLVDGGGGGGGSGGGRYEGQRGGLDRTEFVCMAEDETFGDAGQVDRFDVRSSDESDTENEGSAGKVSDSDAAQTLAGGGGSTHNSSSHSAGRHKHRGATVRKGKRGGRPTAVRSRDRSGGGRSTKRVRFENTVMEKWIHVDEGDERERSWLYGSDDDIGSNGRHGRRADRKRKLAKSQLVDSISEKAVKRSDGDGSRDEKTFPQNSSNLDQADGGDDTKAGLVVENDKVEKLRRNEIINCLCGITEEDGLMIQCDLCLCWQHGHCAGIFRESDVPDKYTCAICKNPYRARSSMKYLHDQEWLKEGTLPSLSFRSKRDDVMNQRKTILKRSHDLSGSIALLARVIHSLRLKVNIAEKKDHPKLWLWAKKWTEKKPNRLKEESEIKEEKPDETGIDVSNGIKEEGLMEDEKQLPKAPEPEAPIDSAECKLNLLDHLIHYQTLVDARLSCIESLVAELESMQDDAVSDETPDRYPRTKATVQMLLRDLNTMKKIAIIS